VVEALLVAQVFHLAVAVVLAAEARVESQVMVHRPKTAVVATAAHLVQSH
jgi:hypothetical protein